jgi:prepilin-type N-terminal cleavage/methylation domain-containing protein
MKGNSHKRISVHRSSSQIDSFPFLTMKGFAMNILRSLNAEPPFRRAAFTLVELLVVIAIIGVLIGLLLPAVQSAREAGRRSACFNKLKQLGLGMHHFQDAYKQLPAASWTYDAANIARPNARTWMLDLMPFIELNDLYSQYDPSKSLTDSSSGATSNYWVLGGKTFPIQMCPSNPYASSKKTIRGNPFSPFNANQLTGGTCYTPNLGPAPFHIKPPDCYVNCSASGLCCISAVGSWWGYNKQTEVPGLFHPMADLQIRFSEITDGLSNTIMLGETRAELLTHRGIFNTFGQGMTTGLRINSSSITTTDDGNNARTLNSGASSYHPNGAAFCMADGATVFIANTIQYDTYQYLGNRKDGQPAKLP